ncbi:hypothetical protein PV963_40170 [Streptomyces coeruleorubidus]|uniref:hypothetical protein n=1 Tax=Streptomyces coeruleorubidus TaxID=116188 RepID=UPI00237F39A7|nr:hypothetical protein [Streptomyces coeruleorubidus]WDV56117.1 hypothetical protein PV963_40170 [Streptomyces coeruleorubidus]
MSVRVIVKLAEDRDWSAVADGLKMAGAERVHAPRESLPDRAVALFSDELGVSAAVDAARGVEGVVDAEPDAMRYTSGPGT